MRLRAQLRAACIDKIVAVIGGIMYGSRYCHYQAYLARRQRSRGVPTRVAGSVRAMGAFLVVAGNRAVLRFLAVLPPALGEELFLHIMKLKKRRRSLP